MRLQTRFFLVLALLLLGLFALLGFLDYQRLRETIHDAALQEARDIRGVLMATRRVYQHQFLKSDIPLTDKNLGFLPAYALARISRDFAHWSNTGLHFNNVSDRPRNPDNAADEVELQAMAFFRENPEEKERMVLVDGGDTAAYYHYSQPIWIERYCLKCHGRREDAPPTIRERYDSAYDYQEGDLRGLMSIKLPAAQMEAAVWRHWRDDMLVLLPLLLLAWAGSGWWFRRLFLDRLRRLGGAAQRIGGGELGVRAALAGSDELTAVGTAFDRMAEEVAAREAALRRQQRLYRTLSETNQLILRLEEPERLYADVCRIAVEYGGFRLAWIGLPRDARGRLSVAASVGPAAGYLDQVRAPDALDQEPSGQAAKLGEAVVCNYLIGDELQHPWQQAAVRHGLYSAAAFPLLVQGEVVGVFSLYADEPGIFSDDMKGLLAEMARDIAFARENFQREQERLTFHAQVNYLTRFDTLTGLPNRSQLLMLLDQSLARSRRHHHWGALLHIDLDRFKRINDSLGNAIGDELLGRVAGFIAAQIRREDSVARLGSDEFLVLLEEISGREQEAADKALEVAEKLRAGIDQSYEIQGHPVHLLASVGIVLFPREEMGADQLLQQAGAAVHQAKRDGRNCVRLFSAEMQTTTQEHLILEQALRTALNKRQFVLFYQPQTNANGQIMGAEALLRWNHPQKGLVPPGLFIPLLEESGLILEVGEWVMGEACRQISAWQESGCCPVGFRVSVNVSPHQFAQPDCIARLLELLRRSGAPARGLELEITESALLIDELEAVGKIRQIQELGIRVAIDDFGTGYSSLSRLARLPVNTIKIDISFVRRMLDDPPSGAIVESIIDIGRRFDLDIVAEGVENEEQLHFLQQRDCDRFQGFLFDRPLPADEFVRRWLDGKR